MKVIIQREKGDDQGTFGVMTVGDTLKFQTLELPWRDNQPRISCIPAGIYHVAIKQSPKFGRVYRLEGVPGRSEILIHSGNFGGDVEKGYKSHVLGCILLGQSRGKLEGQKAVIASKTALAEFMEAMGGEPFEIEIRDV